MASQSKLSRVLSSLTKASEDQLDRVLAALECNTETSTYLEFLHNHIIIIDTFNFILLSVYIIIIIYTRK